MATLLPDGRWQARYRPKGRREDWQTWHSRISAEDAETQKAQYLSSLRKPSQEAPSSIKPVTIDPASLDYYAMVTWWPGVEATAGEGTRTSYLSLYKTWIGPHLGSRPLTEIRREDVQALVGHMVELKKSPGTIRNVRKLLAQIMNDAIDEEVITRNPTRRVKTPASTGKRMRSLPPSKVHEVLEGSVGPMRCACFLAMLCGLREGEVSGLSWDRLDRRNRTLTIDRQHVAARTKKPSPGKKRRMKAELKLAPPKGKKTRIIALPQEMIDTLDKLGNLDSYWIVSEGKEPMSPSSIYNRWYDSRGKLGLSQFTFHDLRHVAAGLLHGHQAGDLTIRDTLGHSTLDMTHVYTEVALATQRGALERVVASVVDASRTQADGSVQVASK